MKSLVVRLGALAALLVPAAAMGQGEAANVSGGALIPEQAAYDVRHYDLALRVDPKSRSIEGTLGARLRLVREGAKRLALDLDSALSLRELRVDGVVTAAERRGDRFFFELAAPAKVGAEVKVAVAYGGRPRVAPNPPWKGGFTWAKTPSGKPWIATSCQGEGADLWWPCKDHPSDEPDEGMDLRIEVPEGLVVAANGTLAGTEAAGEGWTRYRWRVANPINTYAVALNIAPYVVLEDELKSVAGDLIPIRFYALPEDAAKARKFLPEVKAHVSFMESICGPYPFRNEKYGVAQTPHLGMEHQTIIAYGNGYRGLESGYDWLHLHELAHEWWGNLVTNRDWKDMWIHEGFGTYMEALYLERTRGPEAYRREMAKKRGHADRQPVAPRDVRDSASIYFGGGGTDIYFKGAWILHTLRWTIGDEAFFKALRRMCYPDPALEKRTDGSQCRFVDSQDFIDLVSKIAGEDLGWFFDVYLREAEPPTLHRETIDGELRLRWATAREDLVCRVPVPVEIDGVIHRVPMPGGRGEIAIPAGSTAKVDPENRLLRRLERRTRRR
ncbi:MAG: M1 family metallopeptidase [Planctomycetota bacterium]